MRLSRSSILALFLVVSAPVAVRGQEAAVKPWTGIAVKKPVFGGACKLCPWGALAEVVRQAMQPCGYDVQICYNCNAAPSPLIVADARVPPPYRPDPAVPAALAPPNAPGLGPVDFGATAVQFMVGAYRGTGPYASEKPRKNLRLIANIQSPNYLIVASRAETGITDLAQIRQHRWPLRIFARVTPGGLEDQILSYYGIPAGSIRAAGGGIGTSAADRDSFDIIIHASQGLTTAPEFRVWTEVSQRSRLNYIQLPDDLLARLARSDWQEPAIVPVGLLPGIERPIRTVARTGTVVYTRSDVPDGFAYDVAKALDEQQQLLQWSHLFFSYNARTVWKAYEVPLHPGAARYYRERGYMK